LYIVHIIIISISTSNNTIHRFTIYVAGTGLRTTFTNYRRRDCQRIPYLPDRYTRAPRQKKQNVAAVAVLLHTLLCDRSIFTAYDHPTDRRAPRDHFQYIYIDDGRSKVNFGRALAIDRGRRENLAEFSLSILTVCHNIHPYVLTIKGTARGLFFYSKT